MRAPEPVSPGWLMITILALIVTVLGLSVGVSLLLTGLDAVGGH